MLVRDVIPISDTPFADISQGIGSIQFFFVLTSVTDCTLIFEELFTIFGQHILLSLCINFQFLIYFANNQLFRTAF